MDTIYFNSCLRDKKKIPGSKFGKLPDDKHPGT